MTAFAIAAAALFADRNMASDAVYRAAGSGPDVPVRIVLRRADATSDFGGGRFVTSSHMLKAPVDAIADLRRGDTFTTDFGTFEVRGDPVRDGRRTVWRAEAQEL